MKGLGIWANWTPQEKREWWATALYGKRFRMNCIGPVLDADGVPTRCVMPPTFIDLTMPGAAYCADHGASELVLRGREAML